LQFNHFGRDPARKTAGSDPGNPIVYGRSSVIASFHGWSNAGLYLLSVDRDALAVIENVQTADSNP
jgi:hypothetical protein